MVQVSKIDANITGLAYAEEAQFGVLPGEQGLAGSPVWYRLNPNSYSDFGGEVITVAPNPINPSRQKRKGVPTDLNASGGINHNITFQNLTHLMQGVMFANIRSKGEQVVTAVDLDSANPDEYEVTDTAGFIVNHLIIGRGFANTANNGLNVVTAVVSNTSVEVATGSLVAEASPPTGADIKVVGYQMPDADAVINVAGNFPVLSSAGATINFTTLGIVPGQWVYIGGDVAANSFAAAANNGFKRVRSVTSTQIVFDKSDVVMTAETAASGKRIRIFFGDVLKNESDSLIVRRSYNVERTLGAPDNAFLSQIQTEVLVGAVANEFTLNVPQAELATVDVTFIAIDNVQRTATIGPKQTSVQNFRPASEYNTSSDIGRIKLSVVNNTDEAPSALFAFVTEATISINNNITPTKAVGTFGGFDVTAGTFSVSGSITAYFSNVAAVQAVRNNSDVSFDISFVKNNTAMIFDIPLISLGDGRLTVEIDQPITIALNLDAASGEDLDANLNHTLLITYFNYVPSAA